MIKYRADINGLRCVAVLSVLFFHLNNRIIPGGFSGVDIFFVISGFLITGIVQSDLESGHFSMARFYARRIRRIFGALFVMLISCILLVVVSFDPKSYQNFFNDLPYAIFQVSNFLFAQQKGYFDAASEASPLLHTWSLGVEEQFYLIWPLLLFFLFNYCRKRTGTVLLVVAILSFCLSQYLCLFSTKIAFYMLHSRAWELALGGLLFVLDIPEFQSILLCDIEAFSGLGLIVGGFIWLDNSSLFPGVNALYPVLGTLFLIHSGSSRSTIIARVLSWRIFVIIGLISYSLYLWHWALIVFVKNLTGRELTFVSGCGVLVTSLLLATISYHLVEKPLRYGKIPRWRIPQLQDRRVAYCVWGKALFSLLVFGILPLFFSWIFLSSSTLEKNQRATTLTIDVELLHSTRGAAREKIAVYWKDNRSSNFSETNHVSKRYDTANLVAGNRYRFVMNTPNVRNISGLRVDPLQGEGRVKIDNISVSGGFFNISSTVDLRSLQENVSKYSKSVKDIALSDGILIESEGADPYIVFFDGFFKNRFDLIIVFCLFFLCMTFAVLFVWLLGKNKRDAAILCGGAVVMLCVLLIGIRLQYSNYSSWRLSDEKNVQSLTDATAMTEIKHYSKSMQNDVILLGDSHAQHYALPVQKWSEKRGLSFGMFAQPACPPLLYSGIGSLGQEGLYKMYTSCTKRNIEYIDQIIANAKSKYVFFAIRQEFYFANPRQFLNKKGATLLKGTITAEDIVKQTFQDTIEHLVESGKKVIVLGQVPLLKKAPVPCLSQDATILSLPNRFKGSCELEKQFSEKKLLVGRSFFQQLANGSESISFFDPTPYVNSIFGDDNTILYFDNSHMSHHGSQYLSSFVEESLNDLDR